MEHGKIISYVKSRLKACSQPKCMSSRTQCSAQAQVRWTQPVLVKCGKETMKWFENDNCKNRNDSAGQSKLRVIHVGDRERAWIIFASMFTDITNWESKKRCKQNG